MVALILSGCDTETLLTVGALVCRQWNTASRRREAWMTFRYRDNKNKTSGGGGGGGASSKRLRALLCTNSTVQAMLPYVQSLDVSTTMYKVTTAAAAAVDSIERTEKKEAKHENENECLPMLMLRDLLDLGREHRLPLRSVSIVLDIHSDEDARAVQDMIKGKTTRRNLRFLKLGGRKFTLMSPGSAFRLPYSSQMTSLRDLRLARLFIVGTAFDKWIAPAHLIRLDLDTMMFPPWKDMTSTMPDRWWSADLRECTSLQRLKIVGMDRAPPLRLTTNLRHLQELRYESKRPRERNGDGRARVLALLWAIAFSQAGGSDGDGSTQGLRILHLECDMYQDPSHIADVTQGELIELEATGELELQVPEFKNLHELRFLSAPGPVEYGDHLSSNASPRLDARLLDRFLGASLTRVHLRLVPTSSTATLMTQYHVAYEALAKYAPALRELLLLLAWGQMPRELGLEIDPVTTTVRKARPVPPSTATKTKCATMTTSRECQEHLSLVGALAVVHFESQFKFALPPSSSGSSLPSRSPATAALTSVPRLTTAAAAAAAPLPRNIPKAEEGSTWGDFFAVGNLVGAALLLSSHDDASPILHSLPMTDGWRRCTIDVHQPSLIPLLKRGVAVGVACSKQKRVIRNTRHHLRTLAALPLSSPSSASSSSSSLLLQPLPRP